MKILGENLFHDIVQTEVAFREMRATVEDGPFHREPNVFVHTMMVVAEYKALVPTDMDWYDLGLFACLMHDVAKPICKTRKNNAQRGEYWSFAKHDMIGAQMATEILSRHGINEFDIYRLSWMIENHQVFWSAKNKVLRADLARILKHHDMYLPFKYFMIADELGRVCDGPHRDGRDHFRTFELEFGFSSWR